MRAAVYDGRAAEKRRLYHHKNDDHSLCANPEKCMRPIPEYIPGSEPGDRGAEIRQAFAHVTVPSVRLLVDQAADVADTIDHLGALLAESPTTVSLINALASHRRLMLGLLGALHDRAAATVLPVKPDPLDELRAKRIAALGP